MGERFGASSLGWRAMRRQLGSQPALLASIAVAVALTAFGLAAGPSLLEQVSQEDLYATVSDPPAAQRNMRVEREVRLGAGPADDPFRAVRSQGDSFAARSIPPAVSAVISDHYYMVDSPRFSVRPMPGADPPHPFRTFFRFRYQENVEDRVTLIHGSLPAPQERITMLVGTECPTDAVEREELMGILESNELPEDLSEMDCRVSSVPHYQVAISEQTSIDMGYEVGDMMILQPDATDQLFFGLSAQDLGYQFVMSISGLAEFADPEEEYWYGDTSLHRPAIQENADLRIIFATGLMSPADYGAMLAETGEADRLYTWRHFVDPALVQDADIEVLLSELIPFELRYAGIQALPTEPRVVTQLSDLLDVHLGQREETVSILSIAVASLMAVAVAVILLLGVLMTARQRNAVVLTRNRGASTGQLTLTRLYESLALGVPAAVLGYLVAGAVVSGTDQLVPSRVTVALVASVTVVLVGAGWPLFRTRLGALQSRGAGTPDPSPRRVVVEVLVLILTIGAILLLRRRGEVDETPSSPVQFDLLLALTPALVGLAVGLVVMRLYPLAIRGISWVGAKTRGLVSFVGFRRILQQSRLPVLVILLCVSAATYTWVMQSSIEEGQQTSSWQAVGGDYTVKGFGTGVGLPSSVDVDTIGPYDSIALGNSFARARATIGRSQVSTEVLAIDGPAYAGLTAGTSGDARLPSFMLAAPGPNTGTTDAPIPAIVSRDWPSGIELAVGDVFELDLVNMSPMVEVRQLRDRFPDVPTGGPFVVFDRSALEVFSTFPLQPTVAYLRADRAAGPVLRANLADQSTSAVLTSRYETLDRVATDPFIDWASRTLTVLFLFCGVFAAVAAVATPAIASATRRRDLAYLRTLGLDESQSTRMTIIEQVPPVLVGTVVGILTGVGTSVLLDPALTLDVFTGDLVPTALTIDWAGLGLLGVALSAILAVAVVIFVLVNRRTEMISVLRIGDE